MVDAQFLYLLVGWCWADSPNVDSGLLDGVQGWGLLDVGVVGCSSFSLRGITSFQVGEATKISLSWLSSSSIRSRSFVR